MHAKQKPSQMAQSGAGIHCEIVRVACSARWSMHVCWLMLLLLLQVVHENFGILEGLMTTVHAATATQKTGQPFHVLA